MMNKKQLQEVFMEFSNDMIDLNRLQLENGIIKDFNVYPDLRKTAKTENVVKTELEVITSLLNSMEIKKVKNGSIERGKELYKCDNVLLDDGNVYKVQLMINYRIED